PYPRRHHVGRRQLVGDYLHRRDHPHGLVVQRDAVDPRPQRRRLRDRLPQWHGWRLPVPRRSPVRDDLPGPLQEGGLRWHGYPNPAQAVFLITATSTASPTTTTPSI